MTFADKVKYVRKNLCMTQGELAKELGISYAIVNRWERQNREPQLALLGKFDAFCLRKGIVFDESRRSI